MGSHKHKPKIIRLQGKDFQKALPYLTLIAYSKSDNGNICGFYRYEGSVRVNVQYWYSHWFNDGEKQSFLSGQISVPRVNHIEELPHMYFILTHSKDR